MYKDKKSDRIVIKEYDLPIKKVNTTAKKSSIKALKKYIIMSEVLGRPLALRGEKTHVKGFGSR